MKESKQKWFADYLSRWALMPDGEPIITRNSRLLPVRYGGVRAMLKVAVNKEEKRGAALMVWWGGKGAIRVLAQDGDALLLERATGDGSLVDLSRNGRDNQASSIICKVAAKLHAPRPDPAPVLVPLSQWFKALNPAASKYGGILGTAAATAEELLSEVQDVVLLHGDIHHGNILDSGSRGWLAIDPKGLVGERGFDFANIFCNPDIQTVSAPGRLARQADIVAKAAGLERIRLLKWVLAHAGLSAAWTLGDGEEPTVALEVARQAAGELHLSAMS